MIYQFHIRRKGKPMGLLVATVNLESALEFARLLESCPEVERYSLGTFDVHRLKPFHLDVGGQDWPKWETE